MYIQHTGQKLVYFISTIYLQHITTARKAIALGESMSPELINVVILLGITLVTFSTAINSIGPIRSTLSYVMALSVLIMTLVMGYDYKINLDSSETEMETVEAIEDSEVIEEPEEQVKKKIVAPTVIKAKKKIVKKKSSNKAKLSRFMKEGNSIIDQGLTLSESVMEFDPEEIDAMDENEIEELFTEINALSKKAIAVTTKVKSLKSVNSHTKEIKSKMLKAGQQLTRSVSLFKQFLNTEDDEEIESLEEQYAKFGNNALKSFEELEEAI